MEKLIGEGYTNKNVEAKDILEIKRADGILSDLERGYL